MTHFLTTSVICLAAFLGLYLLLLEKEKIHRFNRFYLLGAVAVSIIAPFISFEVVVDKTPTLPYYPAINDFTSQGVAHAVAVGQPEANSSMLLPLALVIYGVVVMMLFTRLILSIRTLVVTTKNNPAQCYYGARLVLVNQTVQPHTFGNCIFINRHEYRYGLIDDRLLQHELAHASQKHSIDIIIIELLLVLFWFNPLLYLYKKAIRLNHEFLADEAVNSANKNIRDYQMLLLGKLAPARLYPASSLTFSLTKKRLIMMTKRTTKTRSLILKLASLPVIAVLAAIFCLEGVARETPALKIAPPVKQEQHSGTVTRDEYFKGVRIIAYKKGTTTKTKVTGENIIFSKLYEELTDAEVERYKVLFHVPRPYVKKSPTLTEIKDFSNVKKYAIWIDGKHVPNEKLKKYNPGDIAYFSGSVILKNARTKKHPQPFQYWFYTHKAFDEGKMGEQKKHYGADTIEFFETMKTDYSRL